MFFKNKFTYGMKSLSQHFDKEVYQYVNITCLLLTEKTPVLEYLFNFEYCEIFKSSYFEKYKRTTTSHVFMKLRKFIHNEL